MRNQLNTFTIIIEKAKVCFLPTVTQKTICFLPYFLIVYMTCLFVEIEYVGHLRQPEVAVLSLYHKLNQFMGSARLTICYKVTKFNS